MVSEPRAHAAPTKLIHVHITSTNGSHLGNEGGVGTVGTARPRHSHRDKAPAGRRRAEVPWRTSQVPGPHSFLASLALVLLVVALPLAQAAPVTGWSEPEPTKSATPWPDLKPTKPATDIAPSDDTESGTIIEPFDATQMVVPMSLEEYENGQKLAKIAQARSGSGDPMSHRSMQLRRQLSNTESQTERSLHGNGGHCFLCGRYGRFLP